MAKINTVPLTVRVHHSVKQAAQQAADRVDTTISQVVRAALRDFIEKHSQPELDLRPIGRPRRTPS